MRAAAFSSLTRFGFAFVVIATTTASTGAADSLAVLRPDEAPSKMLYRALEAQAREKLEERRKAVAGLKTVEAIRQRQTEIRAKFLEALGDLPEKTRLNARVVGKDQRDGYSVERVIYESRPNHHVTANFYLPAGDGPFPGVLVPCGHSANGKAAETYQRISISLAKNGMAALCFDPIGQGERVQLLDANGKPAIAGSTTEHSLAGIGAWLVGRSAASYRIWDGIRSLDYLASRLEVDPQRLGCTGNSGGGTETAYLMALDDRIAVAAPSCYITSLERLFATIGPQDAEQNITGQVAFGMDHGDYAILRAPKPTLFSVGTQDFFDIKGSWDTFRETKLVYGRLGFGERMELFESDEPHGFTKPRREASMRWLRRWLLKKDDEPVETDFPIATDAQLQCTKTGQVLSEFHGRSVFDLNAERAKELAPKRAEYLAKLRLADKEPDPKQAGRLATQNLAEIAPEVRRLIGLPSAIAPAKREDRGRFDYNGRTWHKLVFTTEPGIALPGMLFIPKDSNRSLQIRIGEDATTVIDEVDRDARSAKSAILVLDLRGMGTTAPSPKSEPLGSDWKEAFLGIHLARPLLGQRVFDLLSVVEAVAGEFENRVSVIARGNAGPVALHAAVLDAVAAKPKIQGMQLCATLTSWTDVVQTPVSREQVANVVPGALAYYDLPDLVALLRSLPIAILGPVDSTGRVVAPEEIKAIYPGGVGNLSNRGVYLTVLAGVRFPTPRIVRTADLSIGESRSVILADGTTATVKLVAVSEQRDPIRNAIREAQAKVEINGALTTLSSGNYNLPVAAGGVQVDCPVTGGYRSNADNDVWKLEKDARIRVWPADSPWIEPSEFVYPVRQRWLASLTQMANEPVYVDGGEQPSVKKIYYHYGLDTGGAEGMVDVVAATNGLVVSAGTERLPGYDGTPVAPRYDVVYLLDDHGWYYRYSHLQTIDPAIKPGARIRMGQNVGVLGKEGGSGGWSHLHFDVSRLQPSGKFGIEEGYAFLWQAALRAQKPNVIAVARPHCFTYAGETVALGGSKSWSRAGTIAHYDWTFTDGTKATGPQVEKTYDKPGSYSEILKVTDPQGHVDYDFAVVQVIDRNAPESLPPSIHAAFSPTIGIKPGVPVTFKVRTFRTTDGEETWDFGDGTDPVKVRSDGNAVKLAKDGYAVTTHAFAKRGHYLVRVDRTNRLGATATARLHVIVE